MHPSFGQRLSPQGWDPLALARVERFLEVDHPGRRVAVFDWDHTSITSDVGDGAFIYAAHTLQLRLDERLIDALFPSEVEGAHGRVTALASGRTLAEVRRRVTTLTLRLASLGWEGPGSVTEHLLDAPETAELGHLLTTHYKDLVQTEGLGPGFAYPWVARIWGGLSEAEIFGVVRRMWNSPVRHHEIALGEAMRVVPQVTELMAALRQSGFEVWVVTGSLESVVAALATWDELGYRVPRERVLGVRLATDEGGRSTPELAPDYPFTYRPGKVEVIDRFIGASPLFVAGDSPTDFEMLTHYPETALRLVLYRGHGDPMTSLYAAAATDEGRVALQGLDPREGRWCPLPAWASPVRGV